MQRHLPRLSPSGIASITSLPFDFNSFPSSFLSSPQRFLCFRSIHHHQQVHGLHPRNGGAGQLGPPPPSPEAFSAQRPGPVRWELQGAEVLGWGQFPGAGHGIFGQGCKPFIYFFLFFGFLFLFLFLFLFSSFCFPLFSSFCFLFVSSMIKDLHPASICLKITF